MKKFILYILVIFLQGCIEYFEKMKLNDDGSGELVFYARINREIFSIKLKKGELKNFNADSIRKIFSNKEGIELISCKTYLKDNYVWIETKLNFASTEQLLKLNNYSPLKGLLGKITFSKDKDGNFIYYREIFYDSEMNSKEYGIITLLLSQYRWNYELILPSKIISANSSEIYSDSNKVKWSFSLMSLLHKKVMSVTFERNKKFSGLYVFVLLIVLVLLSILFYLVFKRIIKNEKSL
ncbi:MAG: hypothetical protein N2249_04035 [Melioribacter sp.]|nr:hypothetical protein [Melioribacter sp.]